MRQHVDRQHLLPIVALLPLRHGLDVGVHRGVEFVHAWEPGQQSSTVTTTPQLGRRTILPEIHLHLEALELVGRRRLRLAAHPFAGPLLEPVEFLAWPCD